MGEGLVGVNDKNFSATGIAAFRISYSIRVKYFDEKVVENGETKVRYRGLFYELQEGSIDYTYLEKRVK